MWPGDVLHEDKPGVVCNLKKHTKAFEESFASADPLPLASLPVRSLVPPGKLSQAATITLPTTPRPSLPSSPQPRFSLFLQPTLALWKTNTEELYRFKTSQTTKLAGEESPALT